MTKTRGSARAYRRQSMKMFSRMRTLNKANDRLEEKRSRTPEWKTKLGQAYGRDV